MSKLGYRITLILFGLSCYAYGKGVQLLGLHKDKRVGLFLLLMLSTALLFDGYRGVLEYRAKPLAGEKIHNTKSMRMSYTISIGELGCGLIGALLLLYFVYINAVNYAAPASHIK